MPKSSKKSAVKTRAKATAIDRPFDPGVLEQAYELASRYRLILEPDEAEGFIGKAVEMPECIGVGKTPDQCVRDTREILASALATMIEMGETPPTPSGQQLRTEQINIRVTSEEKLLLEEAARSKGFRGISDFVRTTTLGNLR